MTLTLIVWPRLGVAGQVPVEQVTVTLAGATVTNPPFASLSVRHMIRFDSLFADVQAVPAMKEVGLREPSMAPSRAASLTRDLRVEDAPEVQRTNEEEQQDGQDECELDERLTGILALVRGAARTMRAVERDPSPRGQRVTH